MGLAKVSREAARELAATCFKGHKLRCLTMSWAFIVIVTHGLGLLS